MAAASSIRRNPIREFGMRRGPQFLESRHVEALEAACPGAFTFSRRTIFSDDIWGHQFLHQPRILGSRRQLGKRVRRRS